ncbi:1-acyl-sn-glycerol-3-phosphate acyltransferase [uncultured Paraglaciecola sp.]|uniref:lysophospholipid acyltransferase family protein n=1 Tax=uncultured Paraglaciecola sp. TaxID=1765024 RepID=UPI0026222DEB|nr:lysophospholipid acyltransferase family protein [uncultured Paraglaciecola sp.]
MTYISKIWRFFATAFCFSVFGLSGLLMAIFWLPLYRLKHRDEQTRNRACRYAVHKSFKFFIWLMYWVGVVKVTTNNIEKLANLKGKIVIANHPSLVDVVVLISLIPDANCVVKESLWKNIFTKGVLINTGYLNNADPENLIEDCRNSLDQGSNLIIFPEGTRTTPGKALSFQRGAANLALRSKANFQRTLIKVSPPGLTKGWPWYRIPARQIHLDLTVLEEFDVHPYLQHNISLSVRKLTRDLQEIFSDELAHFDPKL